MATKHPGHSSDVFSFDNYRDFLTNELDRMERRGESAPLSLLAKRLGLSSPSLLSMILHGKRTISSKLAERLCETLSLSGSKKKYFYLLLKSNSGKTMRERNDARAKLVEMRLTRKRSELEIGQYRFLGNWYYPVLYVLAGMKKTRWTSEWLFKALGERIPIEEIESAMEDLEQLGLLKRTGEGWKRLNVNLSTPEDVRAIAFYRYHLQMNRLAEEGLHIPIAKREFNGLTLALPKSRLNEAKEMIRAFRRTFNDHFSKVEKDADDVFQLNIQFFPLTKMEGDEVTDASKTPN